MEYAERMKEIKSSSIREILKFTFQPGVISFAAGSPSPLTFPVEEFGEISKEIFASRAQEALQYNITEGYPPLVDKIVQYSKKRFDMGRDFDRTLIVTGAQQGLDFFAKVFINEGDVVICENPSFVGGMNAFKSYGARMIGVDLEEDGIDVNRVEEILRTEKKVKAIYLIPTFQNPSGITMSAKKRKEIYALAKKTPGSDRRRQSVRRVALSRRRYFADKGFR
jgi:2-aminoadipate transaminase